MRSQPVYRVLVLVSVLAAGWPGSSALQAEEQQAALQLFETRIMPIFKSPEPSSCVQCHLSSVDLKDYIRPSHEQTFAALRDQGLIDLERPEHSKILTLITMGEQDLDEGARLIHERTRAAEYDAFAAWIQACSQDPRLRELPAVKADQAIGPEAGDAVIRHARKDRVLDSFVRNIWSQRMRCFPCHTPHELDENNPQHKVPIERRAESEATFGDSINLFLETPEATLKSLVERSRNTPEGELPLINIQHPELSLLVLKPTSRLPARNEDKEFEPPSNAEPVSHMGGLKMHGNDQSYKSFMAWLHDYARVARGEYTSVEALPADNWFPTQYVLRIGQTPDSWTPLSTVQLFVHAWDEQQNNWSAQPIAFTQGTVTPRGMVNGAMILLAPANREARQHWDATQVLPATGKLLVKAYHDSQDRLTADPTALLGEAEFVGQTETDGDWAEGFRNAKTLSGQLFQK